jgi:hypothetical protein
MMSKKKVRLLRHKKQMEAAVELKRKKQFAKKHGLKLDSDGNYTTATKETAFREYKGSTAYHRETPVVRSLDSKAYVVDKKESLRYTGTLVKGIATMHKSNAVPVINQEEATAISQMRRG